MKRRRTLLLLWSCLLIFTNCNFLHNENQKEWGYRKLLPKSATDIKDFYWEDGFLPDYEYYLRATISREDFEIYLDSLDLVLNTDSSKYTDEIGNMTTGGSCLNEIKDWWDVESNQDSIFVWQNGHEWNIARYIKGYLYLYAHEH